MQLPGRERERERDRCRVKGKKDFSSDLRVRGVVIAGRTDRYRLFFNSTKRERQSREGEREREREREREKRDKEHVQPFMIFSL